MPHLEPHDELGVPWDELADGRVHRLVKGRDFARGAELVEEAAANAAARLERVVRSFREIRHGAVYLWVQFVHHEVVIGDPCPCGNGELLQVNQNFAECSSCKATVALLKPKRERQEHDEAVTEDEPLLRGLFGAQQVASRNGKRVVPEVVDPTRDLSRLGAYSKIVLYPAAADAQRERLYGHAIAPGGQRNLLVVDLPLDEGARIEDPAYPGGWRHAVWSVPTGPFQSLIHLEELDRRDPVVRIDDPLGAGSGEPPGEPSENGSPALGVTGPPDTLEALEDVRLFPHAQDDSKKAGRRFCGYARTSEGETVLLTVRYKGPLQEESTERPVIRCVPLEPFGNAIDAETLFAKEPGSPLFDVESAADPTIVAHPRSDVTRLGAFTKIELSTAETEGSRERMYGRAVGAGDQPNLLVVDFPLIEGRRVKDPAYPGGWRHTVWSVPLAPFERFVQLDLLRESPPDLVVEDPLANFQPTSAPEGEADRPLPPARISELADVRLFRYGWQRKKKESFFGFARTAQGEMVLLTVRYTKRDGERVPDPDDPGNSLHELRAVPLAPFGEAVDSRALFSYRPEEDGDDAAREQAASTGPEAPGAAQGPSRDSGKAERRATRPKHASKDEAQAS